MKVLNNNPISSFIESTSYYTLSSFLNKIISLYILFVVAKELTLSNFGEYTFGIFLVNFTAIVCNLGLNASIEYLFYRYSKEGRVNELVSVSILVPFVFTSILGLIFTNFVDLFSVSMPVYIHLLILLLIKTLFNILQRINSIERAFKSYVLAETIFILSNALIISLYLSSDTSVQELYFFQIISLGLATVYLLLQRWNNLTFNISMNTIQPIFRFSLPILGHSGLHALLGFLDKWYVKVTSRTDAVIADYNFAFQIGEVQNMVVTVINRSVIPFFFDEEERTKGDELKLFRLSLLISIVLVVFLGISLPLVLQWIFYDKFNGAYPYIILVINGYAVNLVYFLTLPFLMISNGVDGSKVLLKQSTKHFIISSPIGLFLILKFGALGGAIFFLVSKIILSGLSMRYLPFEYKSSVVLYYFVLSLGVFSSIYLL